MKLHDFRKIVDACYGASIDASDWPQVFELIGKQFNASGAGIVFYDEDRNAHTVHSTSLNDADEPYRRYWWKHDTRIAIAKKRKFKTGDVVSDFHLITPDQKCRDPFFQEFGRMYGFDELMGYFADDPLGGAMTVSVPRGAKGGPFDAAEMSALGAIGSHVARAFTLTTTWDALNRQIESLKHSLDAVNVGVLVLDARNRVVEASERALYLMRDCIHITRGRALAATSTVEQAKLDAVLDNVGWGRSTSLPARAILRSKDGDPRLLVETLSRQATGHLVATVGCRGDQTFLLLRDFSAGKQPSISLQLEQMGLTRTEARVAMLIGRGSSPREVAGQLSVSHQTVRVHLRSIYAKLSINRQSELASIVSRLDCLTSQT